MSDRGAGLRALLLDGGVVTEEILRSAEARCADGEAALDTALLEEEVLDEAEMVRFLVAATGYPPAPPPLLRAAGPDAATFPRHWAEQLGAAPCRLGARGVEMVASVAVNEARLSRLADLVQVPVALYAAPEFRVREAFARVYGTALDPRAARLVQRFGHGGDPPIIDGSPEARAARRLEEASSQDEVLGALRDLLQARFSFGEVFVVKRGVAVPAGARVPRIPLDEPSLLAHAVSGGLTYVGPVPRGNEGLLAMLGRSAPDEVLLLPLALGTRVVCVLWGESGSGPLGPNSQRVEAIVPRAERALARLLVARRHRRKA